MSLKDLVEGDCSRESAAAEFSAHFVHDKSFRDAGVEHPFQDAGGNISSPDQLVNQFLAESSTHTAPKSFRMDCLLEEMREIESSVSHHAPVQAPGVAVLAAADPVGIAGEDFIWAEQYLESGKQFDETPDGEAIWSSAIETANTFSDKEEYELGFGPNWIEEYMNGQNPEIFDETFKVYSTADDLKETASELLRSVNGTAIENSKFMEFMQHVSDGDVVFPSASPSEEENKVTASKGLVDKWAAEFMQEFSRNSDDGSDFELRFTDYGRRINAQALWNQMTEQWDNLQTTSSTAKEDNSVQDLGKQLYKFDDENPVVDCEDPLAKGKERLAAGDLIGAILYFEAACQQDDKNVEAWLLLGTSQALNEQDPAAIICLMQTLKLDPHNLRALRALAISLTNENYPNHACYILEKWLYANPKYRDLVTAHGDSQEHFKPGETEGVMADVLSKAGLRSSFLKSNYFEKVKDLFIEAARQYPNDVDADIQSCLGILFNLSHDIDKAVDCFRAALQVRQDDFQLWNSYGATLANGGRSEEAVHAYRRALQLYPGFVRARYNVGITCCTLHAYREAAHHFLVSLHQQASAAGRQNFHSASGTTMSDNIWNSLRTVLALMDEGELLKSVEERDLEKLMKAFGVE